MRNSFGLSNEYIEGVYEEIFLLLKPTVYQFKFEDGS